jgi:hypothetical protein
MIAFHGIGRVNQSADLLGKLKESGQFPQVVLPRTHSSSKFLSPNLFQSTQVGLGLFTSGCLINCVQVSDESLLVLPSDIFQRIADLVDNTSLNPGFRENGMDCI